MTDILTILEDAAKEIRALRESEGTYKLLLDNLAIRLAINQLKNGPLDWKNEFKAHWQVIRELVNARRLTMDHGGECYLDEKLLTRELLDATPLPGGIAEPAEGI